MKKIIFTLFVCVLIHFQCKKAQDALSSIKNKIIDGYWADINGLKLDIKNNESKVLDYGSSQLKNYSNYFNKNSTPYIKNITRTSENSWSADIVVRKYDGNECIGISYEKINITLSDSNNSQSLKLSKSDFGATLFTKLPASYKPPVVNSACDTSSKVYQNSNNTLEIYDLGISKFNNIEVRSFYRKPTYGAGCNYIFQTYNTEYPKGTVGAAETEIIFGDRPSVNKVYNVIDMKNKMFRLESDEVGIKYLNNFYSTGVEGEKLYVSSEGGKVKMKADTILTKNLSYNSKITIDLEGY
jgi:hypothetical protein